MSFETTNGSNNGLDILKPEAKIVSELKLLDKYKSDLELLKTGRRLIEQRLKKDEIDDEEINKKLKQLSESIENLQRLIDEYGN